MTLTAHSFHVMACMALVLCLQSTLLSEDAPGQVPSEPKPVFVNVDAAPQPLFQPVSETARPQIPSESPVSRAEFEALKAENERMKRLIEERLNAPQQQTVTREEFDRLAKENEQLKRRMDPGIINGETVKQAVARKYVTGETAAVTRTGKLKIGGLLQAWYYYIQNDNLAWVKADNISGRPSGYGSGETVDNDSFAIRRAQIRFDMDLNENISAHLMLDPAAEQDSLPGFPSNQANGISGESPIHTNPGLLVTRDGTDFEAIPVGNLRNNAVRNGTATSGRLLQDAYIRVHGFIPQNDIFVGQMKRKLGEEGWRDDKDLDFVERAMITQAASVRDIGLQVHGRWFDDRFQYWVGAFNGAGTAFKPRYNRVDDNDDKDFLFAVSGRPIWDKEKWGRLEVGYSFLYGTAGESGGRVFEIPAVLDGLNVTGTVRAMHYAYGHYRPGSFMRGMWVRGEWGLIRDRFLPGELATFPGTEPQIIPAPFHIQGWNVATGYRFGESTFADRFSGSLGERVLRPMEFTARWDVMQNLFYQDLARPTRRQDIFRTSVITLGVNYHITQNAKLQFNYNRVNEDDHIDGLSDQRQAREVRNDSFVINFQVSW